MKNTYHLTVPTILGTFLTLSVICSPLLFAQSRITYVSASERQLGSPHDLVLDPSGQHLLVADVNNNRVAILNPETLALSGQFGSDHQSGTHDVDFDANGNLYVADTHNNRVLIYAMDGTAATRIGELSENIRGPEGVLTHPDGRVYVAGAWSHNVVVYKDQKVIAELKGLSSPHDLEFDISGDIWLADAGNDRLLLLSPELEIKKELSGKPFNFNGVRYLDVMSDGTIIAADKNNHAVKIIDSTHEIVQVIGGSAGLGENQFRTPEGIEIQGETVWISDSGNDRVVKYRVEQNKSG